MRLFKLSRLKRIQKHTIRFTVVSIFILATIVTATIAISLQYHFSKNMATESASQLFSLTSQNTTQHLHAVDQRAEDVTRMFAQFTDLVNGNAASSSTLSMFIEMLKNNNTFYAVYLGFGNGDFYELVNLNASPIIRSQFNALPEDRWVLVTVSDVNHQRKRRLNYLHSDLSSRAITEEPSDYDVRSRLWYQDAKTGKVSKTEPYLFQNLQAPGQTYSAKIPNTETVFAIDIALSSFEEYLTEQGLNNTGVSDKEIYLFQKTGEIIASNQKKQTQNALKNSPKITLTPEEKILINNTPSLKVSNEFDWAPVDFSIAGTPYGYSIDALTLINQMTGLNFEYVNGFTWPELVYGFESGSIDILQPVFNNPINQKKGLLSSSFLELPFAIITSENNAVINNIAQLNGKKLAIPDGWSIIRTIEQYFPNIEIVLYPSTKAVLNAVSRNEVFAGLDNEAVFRYIQKQFFINNIQYHQNINFLPATVTPSLHFVLKHSETALMAIINRAIAAITPEQKLALAQKWLSLDAINSTSSELAVVPYAELLQLAKEPETFGKLLPITIKEVDSFIYLMPVNQAETEFLAIIVPSTTIFASSIDKVKVSIIITTLCLLLILPISWFFSSPIVHPIKILAIENDKIKNRQYDQVNRVVSHIKEIDALALSLVDMASAIKEHEKKQEELMDSFIQLIANTIDEKSPYTGGHCNRVPELGFMLADAAAADTGSVFNSFNFETPAQYREFKIAAWLHDCGKIITPEHIVDKGSKLECIYNRIHEVRMRFEVLWRDAEIRYYQALIESPDNKEQLNAKLLEQQNTLQNDFTFIATSNVGGEFMSDDKVERLKQLSTITWQRNFDDRIGLSPVEEEHLATISPRAKSTLPVRENLLNDKAEHITTRTLTPTYDKHLGIKMAVPENQYNLGELYNLSISRGTLTAEDRYKINEHIIGTIKMLEQLPFPPELANVPRYASTHHETLIGTGYPRKLTAEDLSIPERVLVIADIFEALTAADRPYKKAKSLSVSIDILHKFALDQHIDHDLFELFLTSGVYREYANKFMEPEQIDEVNIDKYLR
ncbi:transporter substrate-binding domain-containing protein [Colwellia sp. D2M02]|uniref:HD domain-containing phosphohydrolase n=1 Tax=Colwellia sp. D2M02 TaxID=2841562 RepID=UPI001C08842C|nr:HD domain-containing phosphohydrolase [Colwellia sp. D2M02]MBU2892095.1 transporter substrate-binding domain-containing protein [Colwellia sp. D2M02]